MKKIYYVFNAYTYTKDGENKTVLQSNIQNVTYSSKFPKTFVFSDDDMKKNGLSQFYDKDVPGVGLSGLYLQTETIENILGFSEDMKDLVENKTN